MGVTVEGGRDYHSGCIQSFGVMRKLAHFSAAQQLIVDCFSRFHPNLRRRHVLEIAQAPTRGRTCGFGDADRRALSAPLIARLRVFSKADNKEIPVE